MIRMVLTDKLAANMQHSTEREHARTVPPPAAELQRTEGRSRKENLWKLWTDNKLKWNQRELLTHGGITVGEMGNFSGTICNWLAVVFAFSLADSLKATFYRSFNTYETLKGQL